MSIYIDKYMIIYIYIYIYKYIYLHIYIYSMCMFVRDSLSLTMILEPRY